MHVSRWLIAVLFTLGSNAARGQEAPAETPPVTTAQLAPPPPTSPAPGPAPYVPRPPAPRGTVILPPYPGAYPAEFASAADFADYGTWRLEQLTARERGLLRLGRPEGYVGKRIAGFALVVGGLTLTVVPTLVLFFATAVPHSGYEEPADGNRRFVRGLGWTACAGIVLTIGGAVWLRRLQNDNRYRDEIRALGQERGRLKRDVQRARRQASLERRTSFHLTQLLVRF